MLPRYRTSFLLLVLFVIIAFVIVTFSGRLPEGMLERSKANVPLCTNQNFYAATVRATDIELSSVVVIGSDYDQEKEELLAQNAVEFVLVLPHKLEYILKKNGMNALSPNDQESVKELARFLDNNQEFDAATGVIKEKRSSTLDVLFEKSACRLLEKNWTLLIHSTGPIQIIVDHSSSEKPLYFQRCNFAETAFVVRKKIFHSIGWHPEFGKTSFMDFFLRSKGELKVAKLAGVTLSRFLNRVDRGKLEMKMEFTDYTKFGNEHDILRIVYPNRIEWTKCSDSAELCPEKSSTTNTNSLSNEAMPICCNVVMNELLVTFVNALEKLGVDYRIVYGTLLGAVRSQAIIPSSDDIDIGIHKKDNDNLTFFTALQQLTGNKYNVVSKIHEKFTISGLLPHFTPTLFMNTSKYFQNEDYVQGRLLFKEEILQEMKKMLPVEDKVWERRFVDIYPSPEEWFASSSVVTINGRKYPGLVDPGNVLKDWYGENYMTPFAGKSSKTSFV